MTRRRFTLEVFTIALAVAGVLMLALVTLYAFARAVLEVVGVA